MTILHQNLIYYEFFRLLKNQADDKELEYTVLGQVFVKNEKKDFFIFTFYCEHIHVLTIYIA